jgi:hypothetical protein
MMRCRDPRPARAVVMIILRRSVRSGTGRVVGRLVSFRYEGLLRMLVMRSSSGVQVSCERSTLRPVKVLLAKQLPYDLQ